MRGILSRALLGFVLVGATLTPALADTHTWTGTNSRDWSDAGNWSPGQVPADDDVVIIPDPASLATPANTPRLDANGDLDATSGGDQTNETAELGTVQFQKGARLDTLLAQLRVRNAITVLSTGTGTDVIVSATGAGNDDGFRPRSNQCTITVTEAPLTIARVFSDLGGTTDDLRITGTNTLTITTLEHREGDWICGFGGTNTTVVINDLTDADGNELNFDNNGSFSVVGGTTTINDDVDNRGTLAVSAGTLTINGTLTTNDPVNVSGTGTLHVTGNYTIQSNETLTVSGGTLDIDGTFNLGSGTDGDVNHTGGTIQLAGGWTQGSNDLYTSTGTTATVRLDGGVQAYSNSETTDGDSRFVNLIAEGTGAKTIATAAADLHVTNDMTIQAGVTVNMSGEALDVDDALSINDGTLTVGAGNTNVDGLITVGDATGAAASAVLDNSGAGRVTANAGLTVDFANDGDYVPGGLGLRFGGAGNWSGAGDDFGAVDLSGGATFTVTLASNVNMTSLDVTNTGPPTLSLSTFTATVSGTTSVSGTLNLGSGTFNAGGAATVAGSLVLGTGTFDAAGNLDGSSGTLTPNTGILQFSGSGTQTFTPGSAFASGGAGNRAYQVTVNQPTTSDLVVVVGGQTFEATARVTVTQGILELRGDSTFSGTEATTISVGGTLRNQQANTNGRTHQFLATESGNSVVVNGTLQFVTDAAQPSPTAVFKEGATVDVNAGATVTFSGPTSLLFLEDETDNTTQWSIDVDPAASFSGDSLDVRDSNAVNQLIVSGSTDSGDNTNWVFAQENVWDNSSTDGLWTTAANWSLGTVPGSSDIAVFDNTSNTACTMDLGTIDPLIAGLRVRSGYTSAISWDASVSRLLRVLQLTQISSGTVNTTNNGGRLFTGSLTMDGGDLTTGNGTGSVALIVTGTFSISNASSDYSASGTGNTQVGSVAVTAGTFSNAGGGTLDFADAGSSQSGSWSGAGVGSFGPVRIGTFRAVTMTSGVTCSLLTFDAASSSLDVQGNTLSVGGSSTTPISGAGTLTAASGTVQYTTAANATLFVTSYGTLEVAAAQTYSLGTGTTTVGNLFLNNATAIVEVNGQSLTIAGTSADPVTGTGTLQDTPATGTVTYTTDNSGSGVVVHQMAYGTLVINDGAATETYNLETGTTSVAVGLTLTDGTLAVNGNTLSIGGTAATPVTATSGTLDASTGRVRYTTDNGGAGVTVHPVDYNQLEVDDLLAAPSETYNLTAATTQVNGLFLTDGTLAVGANTLTIAGSTATPVTVTSGALSAASGTVNYTTDNSGAGVTVLATTYGTLGTDQSGEVYNLGVGTTTVSLLTLTSGTLDVNGRLLVIAGTANDPVSGAGTLQDTGAGTVRYTTAPGAGNVTVQTASYATLQINASEIFELDTGTTSVTGLTLTLGTLTVNGNTLSIGGTAAAPVTVVVGILNAGSGRVIYTTVNPLALGTVAIHGVNYDELELDDAASTETYVLQTTTQLNLLVFSNGATLDIDGNALTVAGTVQDPVTGTGSLVDNNGTPGSVTYTTANGSGNVNVFPAAYPTLAINQGGEIFQVTAATSATLLTLTSGTLSINTSQVLTVGGTAASPISGASNLAGTGILNLTTIPSPAADVAVPRDITNTVTLRITSTSAAQIYLVTPAGAGTFDIGAVDVRGGILDPNGNLLDVTGDITVGNGVAPNAVLRNDGGIQAGDAFTINATDGEYVIQAGGLTFDGASGTQGTWSGSPAGAWGAVTINGSADVQLGSNIDLVTLSMTAGTLDLNGNRILVTGTTLSIAAGTLTANTTGTASFLLRGNATWTGAGGINFGDVAIDSGFDVVSGSDLVTRGLSVTGAGTTLDLLTNTHDLSVAGNVDFSNAQFSIAAAHTMTFTGGGSRTFNPGDQTSTLTTITGVEITASTTVTVVTNAITFDGEVFVTSGTLDLETDTTFNDHVDISGTLRADTNPITIEFDSGQDVLVKSGATVDIDGVAALGKIALFSNVLATQWILDVSAGGSTLTFLDVRIRDSFARNSATATGASDDLGNTDNWSGLTVFTAIWVGDTAPGTVGDGQPQGDGSTWDDDDNWLDGNGPILGSGVEFGLYDVTGPSAGTHPANLGDLTVTNNFGSGATLRTVQLTQNTTFSGQLDLNTGAAADPGFRLTPGTFDLVASGIAGVGTLTMAGGGALTTGGGMTVTNYVDGAGLLTFNGSGSWSGTHDFGQVVVENGATLSLAGNVVATSAGTVVQVRGGATLDLNGSQLDANGNLELGQSGVSNGTLDGGGTLRLLGNLTINTGSTTTNFAAVSTVFDGVTQSVSAQDQTLGAVTVSAGSTTTLTTSNAQVQTLTVNGTFSENSLQLTINGSGTPLTINGTLNVNGTTVFAGTAATTIPLLSYNSLVLQNSGTDTLASVAAHWFPTSITVENGATLATPTPIAGFQTVLASIDVQSGGDYDISNRQTSVSTSLTVGGTIRTSSTLTLRTTGAATTWQGTGSCMLTNGALVVASGTTTLVGDANSGALQILGGATLDLAGFVLTVSGSLTAPGTYTANGGPLQFSGTGNWSGAGGNSYGNVRVLGTGAVTLASAVATVDVFVENGGSLNTNNQLLASGGDIEVAGAGFTNAGGSLFLAGVAAVWSGAGVTSFGAVTINTGASYSLGQGTGSGPGLTASAVVMNGDLDLGASRNLTFTGGATSPLSGAGTFGGGSGTSTVIYNTTAAGNYNLGAYAYNNLTLDSAGSNFVTLGAFTVGALAGTQVLLIDNGSLNVGANHTIQAPEISDGAGNNGVLNLVGNTVTVILTGTGALNMQPVNVLNIGGSTIDYRAQGSTILNVTYNNLTLSGLVAGGSYTLAASPLVVGGALAVSSGSDLTATAINVSGSVSLNGGATLSGTALSFLGTASATFNAGTAAQSLTSVTVTKSTTATVSFTAGSTASRLVTGAVTVNTGTLSVNASWSFRTTTTVGSLALPSNEATLGIGADDVTLELGGTAGAHLITIHDQFRVDSVSNATIVIGDGDTIEVSNGDVFWRGLPAGKLSLRSVSAGQQHFIATTTGTSTVANFTAIDMRIRDSDALFVVNNEIPAINSIDDTNNEGWSFPQQAETLLILAATALDDGAGNISRVQLVYADDLDINTINNVHGQFELRVVDSGGSTLSSLQGSSSTLAAGRSDALEILFSPGLPRTDITDVRVVYTAPSSSFLTSVVASRANQDQLMEEGGSVPLRDGAAASVVSAFSQDIDNNGGLDRLVFFFSEPIGFSAACGLSISGFGPTTTTLDMGGSTTFTVQVAGESTFSFPLGTALTGADIAFAIQDAVRKAPGNGSVAGHDPFNRPAYMNFTAEFTDGRYVLRAGVPLRDIGGNDFAHDFSASAVQIVSGGLNDTSPFLKLGTANDGVERSGKGDAQPGISASTAAFNPATLSGENARFAVDGEDYRDYPLTTNTLATVALEIENDVRDSSDPLHVSNLGGYTGFVAVPDTANNRLILVSGSFGLGSQVLVNTGDTFSTAAAIGTAVVGAVQRPGVSNTVQFIEDLSVRAQDGTNLLLGRDAADILVNGSSLSVQLTNVANSGIASPSYFWKDDGDAGFLADRAPIPNGSNGLQFSNLPGSESVVLLNDPEGDLRLSVDPGQIGIDASQSVAPVGTAGVTTTFSWNFVSGPADITVGAGQVTAPATDFASGSTLTFTANTATSSGSLYVFELVIVVLDALGQPVVTPFTDGQGRQVTLIEVEVRDQAPVAVAGPDRSVFATTLQLDGSGSYDPNGGVGTIAMIWSAVDSTGAIVAAAFDDDTATQPIFMPGSTGAYTVTLTVYKLADTTLRASDTAEISLIDASNLPPTADAGPDLVARLNQLVTLDSSASVDPEGTTLVRAWTPSSNQAAASTLSDSSGVAPTFTPSLPGTYVWSLRVEDGTGLSGTVFVTVTVVDDQALQPRLGPEAVPRSGSVRRSIFLTGNPPNTTFTPPVAVLPDGTERPVTLIDLASQTSDDPAPGATSGLFAIQVVSGASLWGTYYVALQPGDDDPLTLDFGQLESHEVISYGVVGDSVVLDATRSVDDEVVSSYSWEQLDGPVIVFTGARSGNLLGFVPSTAGTYVFGLTVLDNTGFSSLQRVLRVAVVPAGDLALGPPAARAAVVGGGSVLSARGTTPGQFEPLIVEGTLNTNVSLDGSGSFSRNAGAIASYEWAQQSGPVAVLSGENTQTLTVTPRVVGSYEFQLTVTDANGVTDVTTVWLVVPVAGSPTPVARIQEVPTQQLPSTGRLALTLNGSASTGTSPLTYVWSQRRGVPVVIDQATGGVASLSLAVPGSYEFQLRVSDGQVLSAPAIRTFVVQPEAVVVLASGGSFSTTSGGCSLTPEQRPAPTAWVLGLLLGGLIVLRRQGAGR